LIAGDDVIFAIVHEFGSVMCLAVSEVSFTLVLQDVFGDVHTTWKVSCNLLNLRKQFAEGFFRDIFVSH
jgi:hypothetical protein